MSPAALSQPVRLREVLDVDPHHGLAESAGDLRDDGRVVVEGVALTIAAARSAGLPDLKISEPTNTPSAPSCIIIAASAGVAIPPAVNSTTGSLPVAAISLTRSYGARSALAARYSSSSGRQVSRRIWSRIWRMCLVALEMSPVPASPLERIIAAPSLIRRSASPRFVAPQTNGTVNAHLSM